MSMNQIERELLAATVEAAGVALTAIKGMAGGGLVPAAELTATINGALARLAAASDVVQEYEDLLAHNGGAIMD